MTGVPGSLGILCEFVIVPEPAKNANPSAGNLVVGQLELQPVRVARPESSKGVFVARKHALLKASGLATPQSDPLPEISGAAFGASAAWRLLRLSHAKPPSRNQGAKRENFFCVFCAFSRLTGDSDSERSFGRKKAQEAHKEEMHFAIGPPGFPFAAWRVGARFPH
jgi:hypothetical protein